MAAICHVGNPFTSRLISMESFYITLNLDIAFRLPFAMAQTHSSTMEAAHSLLDMEAAHSLLDMEAAPRTLCEALNYNRIDTVQLTRLSGMTTYSMRCVALLTAWSSSESNVNELRNTLHMLTLKHMETEFVKFFPNRPC